MVGLGPRDHVTLSLCELHWLPIAARIDYKLCLLVHKSFVGQVPDYITELLTPAASDPSRSSLRSSSSSNLIVRRARRKIGDRAFAVAAPVSGIVCPPNLRFCDPRLHLSDISRPICFLPFMERLKHENFDCVMRHRTNCRGALQILQLQLQLQSFSCALCLFLTLQLCHFVVFPKRSVIF